MRVVRADKAGDVLKREQKLPAVKRLRTVEEAAARMQKPRRTQMPAPAIEITGSHRGRIWFDDGGYCDGETPRPERWTEMQPPPAMQGREKSYDARNA